ncbi:MAG: 16S rRNA processing protein RimM [Chitinophagaceae bacterium]|jgi:16S rRNA processing protein RimM|nr:16S rRNA processing protein RimM [Chitinophagaceae bacterium]
MPDYVHIGKLAAPFGVKGELILQHALGKKTALKGLEVLFVEEQKGSFLPYFMEEARIKDEEETYLKLEGVNTRETAQRIAGRNVWFTQEDFRKQAGKSAPLSLLGYELITDEGEELGPVEAVIEQPHQVLLRISLNGKEALIPLHEESLDRVDHTKKKLYVILPDGLLDIYR